MDTQNLERDVPNDEKPKYGASGADLDLSMIANARRGDGEEEDDDDDLLAFEQLIDSVAPTGPSLGGAATSTATKTAEHQSLHSPKTSDLIESQPAAQTQPCLSRLEISSELNPTQESVLKSAPENTSEEVPESAVKQTLEHASKLTSEPATERAELEPDGRTVEARERKRQARKRARKAAARRNRASASVYVTGLPEDASVNEVVEHFTKCGILLPDSRTGQPRVKLYVDEGGKPKGDALITYAFAESVENALTLLDGANFREKYKICVQPASFDHKLQDDQRSPEPPTKRPAIRPHDLIQEAIAWDDGPRRRRGVRPIVVLKNVFVPAENPDYSLVHQDLVEGCEEFGVVENVTVFEGNTEGAAVVRFDNMDTCFSCIKVMDGRWYDGRQLSAELYDGTDLRHKENEEERAERDERWQEWLEE